MTRGFANIGFVLDDNRSYMNLRQQVVECGQTIHTPVGTYFFWSPGGSLELWAKVKPEDDIGHLHAHFAGAAHMTVALVERNTFEDDTLAEGLFVAYPNPQKGKGFLSEHPQLHYGDGTYSNYNPFVFITPDFDRYAEIQLPVLTELQLTAFPLRDVFAFESEDAWVDWQLEMDDSGEDDPSVWSGETFCPSAMFFKKTADELYPKPTAFIAGTVLETAILTNPVTEFDFSWAKVQTIQGEIDLVFAPEVLNGYLAPDGVVAGDFYLSGRLLDI